jgi:alpha-glucosidase
MSADGETWWRSGVLYQIYPRSFADSNGDGHGDLQGVVDHLDHLQWLGIDGIWLNPISPSPNADWGYDVSDYTSIHPDFGDLDALDRLVAQAGARGIRVVLDLVPNHTSDRHPWFVESRSSRDSARRDWYVWADAKPDGSPPNNWLSVFGGPAWSWDEPTEQYYLHNFLAEQPDLNWWSEDVRDAFDDIVRFWLDRGVAGYRIDVAHGLVKDRELRDNPAAEVTDHPSVRALGQRSVYNMNRPEVHDVFRRWRTIADSYDPPAVLVGETWVLDVETLASFYGSGDDELDLALNVPFIFAELGPEMRSIVESIEATIPTGGWPTWNGSNHDAGRFPTRWCAGDERKVRAALVVMLTLRGTPILYYGDEIGMPQAVVPRELLRDPVGLRGWPDDPDRDGARTPMPWVDVPHGGFTAPGVEPWLPVSDPGARNVASQREETGSDLHLCRDLIALRRARTDLRTGPYASVPSPEGVWAWRRGDGVVVAVNGSDRPTELVLEADRVLIGTRRCRDGEDVHDSVSLEPWEALVLSRRVGEPDP